MVLVLVLVLCLLAESEGIRGCSKSSALARSETRWSRARGKSMESGSATPPTALSRKEVAGFSAIGDDSRAFQTPLIGHRWPFRG
jgi:hypothetical protein